MPETKTTPELLAAVPLLADLDPREIEEIAHLVQRRYYAAGEELVRQGLPADGMHVLQSGKVRVSVRLPGDEEIEVGIVSGGGILGEVSLIDQGPRSASAIAVEDTVSHFLDSRIFTALRTGRRPATFKIARRLGAIVCDRLRRTLDEIAGRDGDAEEDGEGTAELPQEHVAGPESLDRPLLLRSIPFFRPLGSTRLQELIGQCRLWSPPRGTRLFREGDRSSSLWIVARGAVQLSVAREEGEAEKVQLAGPGVMAGQLSLLDGKPRAVTATVRENAVLLEMRPAAFERSLSPPTALGWELYGSVMEQLIGLHRAANRRLAAIATEARAAATDWP